MRKRVRVAVLTAGLVLLMGSTALAQHGGADAAGRQDSKFIEDTVYEVSVRREPKADALRPGDSHQDGDDRPVVQEPGRSYRGQALLDGPPGRTAAARSTAAPRGIDVDWWTAPLNNYKTHSSKWDWYTTGKGGTGRSNTQVQFVFGVPTPWGPVGSSYSSRIYTTVNGNRRL